MTDKLGSALKHRSSAARRCTRLVAAGILASLTVLGVACSESSDSLMAPKVSTTSARATDPLSAHFEIDRNEVRSGDGFSVTIVIINNTGSPIESYACSSLYQAELASPSHVPDGASLACMRSQLVPVGESRISVKVPTRSQFCSDTPSTRFDPCSLGDRHPPYPAGPYELIATSQDPRLPIPPPVAIELVD